MNRILPYRRALLVSVGFFLVADPGLADEGALIEEGAEKQETSGKPVSEPATEITSSRKKESAVLNPGRGTNFAAVVIFAGLFFAFAFLAKRGRPRSIRTIEGLDLLRDAVGRAGEMGRPIIFVPGLQTASDPATVAAMSILSDAAKGAARLGTRVRVPIWSPLTWPVAENVMRDAYLEAGRAEDFRKEDVMYLTSRSFTLAAAVMGMMAREKPAANLFMGHFYAESLLLAETGVAHGAVQIAGTESEVQLPFFITTCDYTLIGEELFAAAAEISGDPMSRSTIAAHDGFKLLAIALILVGLVLASLDAFGVSGAGEIAHRLADFLVEKSK